MLRAARVPTGWLTMSIAPTVTAATWPDRSSVNMVCPDHSQGECRDPARCHGRK
jgi:hypothetical protein